jgi:Dockerin type I domain
MICAKPTLISLLCGLAAATLLLGVHDLRGQSSADLAITSPVNGATFAPGQNIPLTVYVNPNRHFGLVSVLGTVPFGNATALGPAFVFPDMPVPVSIAPGQYRLTAVAATSDTSGMQAISQPVIINVERLGATTASLKVQPNTILFQFVGEQIPLVVWANFSDGTISDVTNSSKASYASASSSIAAVDPHGRVTAMGAGATNITIQYGGQIVIVPIVVPAGVRGDINGDGVVNMDDVNLLLTALNTTATGSYDARDLNGDGKIDVLDARIIVTLCSKARCGF